MTTRALVLTGVAAALSLGACQSPEFQRVREMIPSRTAPTEPAPVTTGTGGTTTQPTPIPRTTTTSTPTASKYVVPTGGPNTFSLSVSECASGCDVTNVMIDPDNYRQRVSGNDTSKGQGRAGLYDDVTNAFQAQGFYAFQGELDILPSNRETCPDHEAGYQVFFISMARNSGGRVVNFDTGCAGSASADAAADAINSLVKIADYTSVISGTAATQ